jgi:hypothetical protein
MPRWLFSQDTDDCQATALRVAVQMCGKEEPLPGKRSHAAHSRARLHKWCYQAFTFQPCSRACPGPGVSRPCLAPNPGRTQWLIPCPTAWKGRDMLLICPDVPGSQHQAGFPDSGQPVRSCPASRRSGPATARRCFCNLEPRRLRRRTSPQGQVRLCQHGGEPVPNLHWRALQPCPRVNLRTVRCVLSM